MWYYSNMFVHWNDAGCEVRYKVVKLMSCEDVSCELWVVSCELWVMSCELWVVSYELEGDEGHGLKTALLD